MTMFSQRIRYAADTAATGAEERWARLEQVYQPGFDDAVGAADITAMLAAARSGKSAFSYVYQNCPSLTIIDGTVVISLEFMVWLSHLDLEYSLAPSLGVVAPGELQELARSFDVIFNGASAARLPFYFVGDLSPEMPVFSPTGETIDLSVPAVAGAAAVDLGESCYTVLRAIGRGTGYKHVLNVVIDKADTEEEPSEDRPLFAVNNLALSVAITYADENGEPAGDVLSLKLPACVSALLAACPDGKPTGWPSGCWGSCARPVIYFNKCNGHIITVRWEERR